MKRIQSYTTLLLIIAIFVFTFSSVFAYVPAGMVWEGSTFPITVTYRWGANMSGSSVIKSGYQSGINDWNSMQMRLKFTLSSTSNNSLNSYYSSSDPRYGYNTVVSQVGKYVSYTAYVNSGNPYITLTNVARSAAAHELGHALSLGESDVTDALMDQGRERTEVYRPTQDDLDGINEQY